MATRACREPRSIPTGINSVGLLIVVNDVGGATAYPCFARFGKIKMTAWKVDGGEDSSSA